MQFGEFWQTHTAMIQSISLSYKMFHWRKYSLCFLYYSSIPSPLSFWQPQVYLLSPLFEATLLSVPGLYSFVRNLHEDKYYSILLLIDLSGLSTICWLPMWRWHIGRLNHLSSLSSPSVIFPNFYLYTVSVRSSQPVSHYRYFKQLHTWWEIPEAKQRMAKQSGISIIRKLFPPPELEKFRTIPSRNWEHGRRGSWKEARIWRR